MTKSPDYAVFLPVRRKVDDDKTDLFRAGSAWLRPDGNGISVKLSVLPIGPWDGQIYLFPPREDKDGQPF